MKHLLATLSLVAVTATPALANTSKADIQDHYKNVIVQTPYQVEVCKNVQVPYGQKKGFGQNSAIVGGIIGGIVGNQIGKGGGKEAATGVGAIAGAIIGGNKDKGPEGYETVQKCHIEKRYREVTKEVYSHSTVTFWVDSRQVTLQFQK